MSGRKRKRKEEREILKKKRGKNNEVFKKTCRRQCGIA